MSAVTQESAQPRSEVAQSMAFDHVRYAQVWEDPALLVQGLAITPDDDVLSIASAGCNVLALMLQGPRSITAVDLSPAQIALVELKLAGLRALSYSEFLSLLGVRAWHPIGAVYDRLRPALSASARDYWDARCDDLQEGIVHAGRLERFFAHFRTTVLPRVWDATLIDRLFAAPNLQQQACLFTAEALNSPFLEAFNDYFSRDNIARFGRDPAQFKYVEAAAADVTAFFLQRFCHACTHLPMRGNYFLEFFLRGRYDNLEAAPPYLTPDGFDRARAMCGRVRVRVVRDEIETVVAAHPRATFSKANLSDIFEYMSAPAAGELFAALARALRPGGRIAYWNLLVPRERPDNLAHCLRPLSTQADHLWQHDRAWFYRAFRLDEVLA